MGLLTQKVMHASDTFMLQRVVLIVGLGNVGEKYVKNRHNIGFLSLEHIASDGFNDWKEKSRLKASIAVKDTPEAKIILAKPTTMMNLSGEAVQAIMKFYKIQPEDVLVIYDDVDIAFGTIRTRGEGGSGGHNGIKSLLQHIDPTFSRVRVGVKNDILEHQDTADFVLSNFSKEEQQLFTQIFTVITSSVNKFVNEELTDHTQTLTATD